VKVDCEGPCPIVGAGGALKARKRTAMPIKVYKVADIIDGKIVYSGKKSLVELAKFLLGRLGLDFSDPSFGVRTYTYKSSFWVPRIRTHLSHRASTMITML
jgi:hypothetical protein